MKCVLQGFQGRISKAAVVHQYDVLMPCFALVSLHRAALHRQRASQAQKQFHANQTGRLTEACQALRGHMWLLPAWLQSSSAAHPSSGPTLDAQHLPRAAHSRPSMPAQHAATEGQRPRPTRHTRLRCALKAAQSPAAQVQNVCYSGSSTAAVPVHLQQLHIAVKSACKEARRMCTQGRNKALAAPMAGMGYLSGQSSLPARGLMAWTCTGRMAAA